MQRLEQGGLAEVLHNAVVQGREQQLREERGRDEHHEQPVAAAPECDDEDGYEDDRGGALGGQVDAARHDLGQRIEGADQVDLEAEERVGRAGGDQ